MRLSKGLSKRILVLAVSLSVTFTLGFTGAVDAQERIEDYFGAEFVSFLQQQSYYGDLEFRVIRNDGLFSISELTLGSRTIRFELNVETNEAAWVYSDTRENFDNFDVPTGIAAWQRAVSFLAQGASIGRHGVQAGGSLSTLNNAFNESILEAAEPKANEEEQEGKQARSVTSDAEVERFESGGVSDFAVGVLGSYEVTGPSWSTGIHFTYAHAPSTNLFSAAGFFKIPFTEKLSAGALVNVNGGSGGTDSEYSAGPFVALNHQGEIGTIGVGVMYQFDRVSGENTNLLVYGTTVGFYTGERGAVNVMWMRISDIEDFGASVSLVGAEYTLFISRSFAFTTGYKTVLELTGFSSHKFSIGVSRTLW